MGPIGSFRAQLSPVVETNIVFVLVLGTSQGKLDAKEAAKDLEELVTKVKQLIEGEKQIKANTLIKHAGEKTKHDGSCKRMSKRGPEPKYSVKIFQQ